MKQSKLVSHPSKPQFYLSANAKNGKNALITCLDYDQHNPHQSYIKSVSLDSIVNVLTFYNDEKIIMGCNFKDQYRLCRMKQNDHSLWGEKCEMQCLIQGNGSIIDIKYKKDQKSLYALLNNGVQSIDLEKQKVSSILKGNTTNLAIDPLHNYLTIVEDNRKITILQKNNQKKKYGIQVHQKCLIQGLDYNPNRQYYLMTISLDTLKFWDIRKSTLPIKCYNESDNLLLNAKYNPNHDELISCTHDDGSTSIIRISSISSSVTTQNQDTLVKLFDQHQDSVYEIAWGLFSPWLFASLSYSAANIVVNLVPSVQKYRILL